MIKCVFLFGFMVMISVNCYKNNFNININLSNDNGNVHISSVKLTHLNEPNNNQPPSQTTPANYNNTNRINRANNYSENSYVNSQNRRTKTPTYGTNNNSSVSSGYSRTGSPNNTPVGGYQAVKATGDCMMNQINCALSGANGEKFNYCLSCAKFIYHPNQCDKYEPLSFLSLFSQRGEQEVFDKYTTRRLYHKSSMLEIDDNKDFTSEGLLPLNIEPKVSVHDLLYSYDHQNHIRPTDLYCNDVECLRLRDRTSCISQLPAQNQYECGSCWIFANTLHLEILICMESRIKRARKFSEMYISSCLNTNSKNPCTGGNTYLFSQIISQYQYIPSKDDLKYNVPVMNSCPRWDNSWINQKPNIELLSPEKNKLNSFKGFILIKRHEYDNSEEFVNLIKDMVKEKGSVVISMKGQSVLKHDHDGTKVIKLCHYNNGTHSMVIFGYGTYTDENNEERRYWHIRNSWGPNWGDNGNFKLDIDGPAGCNANVFEYAVVLNVKINKNSGQVNNGYVPDKINNIGNGKTRKISVKYNDKTYSRIFFADDDFNSGYDCNRVFSINQNRNEECVNKCKKNLSLCKNYGPKDMGACLFSLDQDYDCMMCGV